jgi:hypothetical protein
LRRRLVAVAVLVVLGLAVLLDLVILGQVAGNYRERAEPAQRMLIQVMRPVYRSFSSTVFGVNDAAFRRATSYAEKARAYDRLMAVELRQLRGARRSTARALRAFARAPRNDLLEVPEWPVVGNLGKLGDAHDVADGERLYLRRAPRVLREYARLLTYHIAARELDRATSSAEYRAGLPAEPSSVEAVASPIERIVRELTPRLRRFRDRKPPPDARRDHELVLNLQEVRIARLRDAGRGIRRLDFARVQRADEAIRRATHDYERHTRYSVPRLLERSRTARAMRDLRQRERELLRGLDRL